MSYFTAAGEWLAHRRAAYKPRFYPLVFYKKILPLAGAPKARLGEGLDHSK